MAWTRLTPLALCLPLACTLDNPAFDDEAASDQGSETRAESDSSTESGDASTSATSTSASESTSVDTDVDTNTSMGDATSEGPLPDLPFEGCPEMLRAGLQLDFGDPFYFDDNCPDTAELFGRLAYDPNFGSLVINRCEANDIGCLGACGFEKHPIDLGIDLTGFSDMCVRVQATKPIAVGNDVCSWGAVSMFTNGNPGMPLAITVTAGNAPTLSALSLLGGHPTLVNGSSCDCASLGKDELCCIDAGGVKFFEFLLPNQAQVAPGETLQFNYAPFVSLVNFHAVQAQRIGECNPNVEVETSWAMWAAL